MYVKNDTESEQPPTKSKGKFLARHLHLDEYPKDDQGDQGMSLLRDLIKAVTTVLDQRISDASEEAISKEWDDLGDDLCSPMN